ncbi:DNA mismatch repair protein [Clavibacter michiganensis subsp. michiganensis]|nr:DNA mismatch repair protein [Clavibacter michiganensis subsp. michiganensis]OUE07044.1 DNA mismatch repair protein [Clavibacter michiganensis subsp. michiganensis]
MNAGPTVSVVRDLPLSAGGDLVTRLARERDPVRAVVELVWNAIDAEADTIRVAFARSDMNAIESVTVEDDGHGISSDEVQATFGRIGGSWKALATRSKNAKRGLHGKLGEGRLRAFALGSRVTWASESVNTAGDRERVVIEGAKERAEPFSWEAQPSTATKTGTVVAALNEQDRSLNSLISDTTLTTLSSHFAPVLLNDETLAIVFDRAKLDPADEILHDTTISIVLDSDPEAAISVRIIEWRTGKHRAVYFGEDAERFVVEMSGAELDSQAAFSAYVTWNGFDVDSLSGLGLGEMAPDPAGAVWRATRTAVKDHFASRRRARRRDQIDEWKSKGIYPYKQEPTTKADKAERAVFDIVSSALVPQIPNRKDGAQLTLNLLRDALKTDPENLAVLVSEFVALSEQDRQVLTKLLGETSLAGVIRSANLVTSRSKFLAGLEHLLFDPEDSKKVGERDHLHKILEHELWIFGEEYHFMNSERGLTQMLRTHLKLEGLPDGKVEPVKRWHGKSGRVDLHVAAKSQEHDRVRHLVVELKAPDVTAGRAERDQIEDYVNVVVKTPAFASDRANWNFILVVTDYDEVIENSFKSDNREIGLVLEPEQKPGRPEVRAYVRRWSDIIAENKRRLDFVTSSLEFDPSIAEGLAFIREEYAEMIPEGMASEEQASDGDQ